MVVDSIGERSQKPERGLHVLVLNSGSSSLKFGLYRVCSVGIDRVITGEAEAIGQELALFTRRIRQVNYC